MTNPPTNGLCNGHPTEWWFPIANNRDTGEKRKIAREGMVNALKLCNACPERIECLEYSLEWEPFGIWGGLPERERAKLRRRRGLSILRQTPVDVLGQAKRV